MNSHERIVIFDSLRAYCALWVALVHLARLLTLQDSYFIPDSSYGVEIFFILSGYVIADLLERENRTYAVFIFRRYMRLAPIFLFFCVIYLLQTRIMTDALLLLDTDQFPVREQIGIYNASLRDWHWHLPAHATLLHGLMDSGLANASKTIILQGWSISVEWQFYVVAPVLLWIVKNNRFWSLLGLLIASALLSLYKPVAGVYFTDHILSFLAGIFSFTFLHKHPDTLKRQGASAFLLVLSVCFAVLGRIELALWCGFLLLAYGDVPALLQRIFYRLFANRVMQWMGRISYSFFLCHMLTIYYAILLVSHVIDPKADPELFYLVAMPIAILFGVALSALTFRYIEEPLIRWSKAVTDDQAARRGT